MVDSLFIVAEAFDVHRDIVGDLKDQIKKADEDLQEAKANLMIPCASKTCGKETKISDLELIDEEYYVSPRGCTEGDYWLHSEYQYFCPHCNVKNRFLFNSLYDIEYDKRSYCSAEYLIFREWRGLFKNVELYKNSKNLSSNFVINYFFDKNLKSLLSEESWKKFLSAVEIKHLHKYGVEIPDCILNR